MVEKVCSLLPNGWVRVASRFFRASGRKKLADAAFHLMWHTEYTTDDEQACEILWELL
jgi:hypothetical protein